MSTQQVRSSARPALVLAGVLLISVNLRAGLAAYPAVLGQVRDVLGVSAGAAGLVQAGSLVAMGLGSFLAVRLTVRVGRVHAMTAAVSALLVGTLLRLVSTLPTLVVGSIGLGAGIGVAGVLLSALVKEHLAARAGLVTGLYVVAMLVGATVASAGAVPLSDALGGPAQSMGAWSVPAALALLVWLPIAAHAARTEERRTARQKLPWRAPLARVFAAYMVLSSMQFYGWLTWLAPYYVDRGLSAQSSALVLSLYSIGQIPAALVFPALAERHHRWLAWSWAAIALAILGSLAILLVPQAPFGPWPWVLLVSIGVGAGFPMALTLVSWKSRTPEEAAGATAVALGIGYLGAAVAPLLMGVLRDVTHSFTTPILVLLAAACVQLPVARTYNRVRVGDRSVPIRSVAAREDPGC